MNITGPRRSSGFFGTEAGFSRFNPDGTLRMEGSATVFKDELQSLLFTIKGNPSDKIVVNAAEGTVEYTDTAALANYSVMNIQLNHDWKIQSEIFPHIHWFQETPDTPNWLLQYRWQLNGFPIATLWVDFPLKHNAYPSPGIGENKTQITAAGGGGIIPPANAGLSCFLQLRLIRDCINASGEFAGADPVAGNVGALNLDVHYEIDSIGSTDEYVK